MKTKRTLFSATRIPALGLLLLGASGCSTLDDMISRQTTQQREDIATIQEDTRKLSGASRRWNCRTSRFNATWTR